MTALVIGLGSADRGDDAAGLEAARLLARLAPSGTRVCALPGRETTLLDLWMKAPLVVVIDAVISGAIPGTVHVVDAKKDRLRLGTPPGSSHAFGLAEVIELARALGQIPKRLVIVGIEAADCGAGARLSAPVRDGVHTAVRCVLEQIEATSLYQP